MQTALLHEDAKRTARVQAAFRAASVVVVVLWAATFAILLSNARWLGSALGSGDFATLLWLYGLASLGQALNSLVYGLFVLLNRTPAASLTIASPPLVAVGLIYQQEAPSLEAAVWTLSLAWAAVTAPMLMVALLQGRKLWVRPSGARRLVRFGAPLAMATAAGKLMRNSDKVLVAAASNDQEFAEYANGAFEIPLISVVTGAVTSVLQRDFASLLREGKVGEVLGLQWRSMVAVSIIILPVWTYSTIMAGDVMALVFGEQYRSASLVFQIYLLLLPARTVMWGNILIASGRTGIVSIVTVATLGSNLALTLVLLRFFPPWSAAVSSVVTTYIVGVGGRIVPTARSLDLAVGQLMPWLRYLRVILLIVAASFPAAAVGAVLTDLGSVLSRLLVVGLIHTAVMVALVLTFDEFVEVAQRLRGFASSVRPW